MAARPRKRPVLDQLRDARRELDTVNTEILAHIKMCCRCKHVRTDPWRSCDTGWELAKRQARAGNAVRRAEDKIRSRPVQAELW